MASNGAHRAYYAQAYLDIDLGPGVVYRRRRTALRAFRAVAPLRARNARAVRVHHARRDLRGAVCWRAALGRPTCPGALFLHPPRLAVGVHPALRTGYRACLFVSARCQSRSGGTEHAPSATATARRFLLL